MESSFSSMMSSSKSLEHHSSQQQQQKQQDLKKEEGSGGSRALVSSSDYSPWFFPRRWMLPRLFGDEEGRMRSLDLFQHEDDQVIRIREDDTKFEVSLDMHAFRPDEIKVNVRDGALSVEASHEEKSEGRYESRSFSRSYTLPRDCQPQLVHSNLSSDGILVVAAPKKQAVKDASTTAIPVEHK